MARRVGLASLDAEILLAYVLNVSRSYLYAHPEHSLTTEQEKKYADLTRRRLQGEPIAYLTGRQEFWSLDLLVTADTLIPRPETELLVELVLKETANSKKMIADLGTGSGAIALAIAHERPDWVVHATDISESALDVAKQNAVRLQIHNVLFSHGSWCDALPVQQFDTIVSNPPYIDEQDVELQQSVLFYEPKLALISPESGLEDIRKIIQQARAYLKPGGSLFLEHGFQQAKKIKKLFTEARYTKTDLYQDLAGLDRVTGGQWF